MVPSRAQPVYDDSQPDGKVVFRLRSSRIGDAVVVEVAGEVDMATAPELARAIDAGLDGAGRVVVDLSEATFLDSSALNTLVHCQRGLAEEGVAFSVVSPSGRVLRKVFEITRLTEPLSVVESVEEALGPDG